MNDVADLTDSERQLVLDLCLRVGEVLLASGAGAADVTVTMDSVARHLGLRQHETDVTFTSLTMSHQVPQTDEDQPAHPPMVMIRRVKHRDIDYATLTEVDHLVGDILRDRADVYLARSRMATIVTRAGGTRRWLITLGWGVMCSGVAVMLGGDWLVTLIAFLAAGSIDRLKLLMAKRRLPGFYQQVAGGGVATLLAVAAAASGLEVDSSLVVTANIIMLLAGVGFMGALQDALSGFYVTAGARMIEALLATAGIIGGVSGGLAVGQMVGVNLGRLDPGAAITWNSAAPVIVGAAVAAAGFAFASQAPPRSWLPVALVGGAAISVFSGVDAAGFGRPWAAGTAAFMVGLVGYSVAGRVRVPPLVVVVSAVVPMLPGLSIYRGLSLLADGPGSSSAGLLAMVTAASVAIALASGVILGEYVAQPLKREAAKLEKRLAGPRLVGPFRARRPRG
ncbi:threonine/serine ThrE exporter family protein [Nocardioides limicola]|uniref:threonine/serine ThrE exporter family protein n=1 Tax=Nocardioides limicola TaxID=2803368 RepID=UPI00193BF0CF|nr:threonine/serine exporter family protein [Nocardioides sp. DJM-14]